MKYFIPIKAKGKFPGRNKRETNVIRSMRTELSVVSRTQLYKNAYMIQKSFLMLVKIAIFFCLLLLFLFNLASFLGVDLDLGFVLQKLNSVLLSKVFHFLLGGLGWGFLIAAIFAFWDPELAQMVMPAGASGTSSSDSTAKPSPSALDQRADELLEKNLEALKTSLGEGERISEVRETIKENFDVKNPGEEFELIKNMERSEERRVGKECRL